MEPLNKWLENIRDGGSLRTASTTNKAILELAAMLASVAKRPVTTSSDSTTDSHMGSTEDSLSHFGSAGADESELTSDVDLANINPFETSESFAIDDLLPKELKLDPGNDASATTVPVFNFSVFLFQGTERKRIAGFLYQFLRIHCQRLPEGLNRNQGFPMHRSRLRSQGGL